MVNGVARLVKMCRHRSGLDELMVILDGKTMFAKAFVQLAFCLSHVLLCAFLTFNQKIRFWEPFPFVPRPQRLNGTDGSGDKYIQEFQHDGCSRFKDSFKLKFIALFKENTPFRNIRIEKCIPKILQMCFDVLICSRFSFAF